MSTTAELTREIAKLAKIQTELVSISGRSDHARKLDLVNLRRELSLQIGSVIAVAEAGFLLTSSEQTTLQFRNLLSAMRRAAALHQANFPAVKLDEQNAEYQVSVKAVREANLEFMNWAQQNIV